MEESLIILPKVSLVIPMAGNLLEMARRRTVCSYCCRPLCRPKV
jgi:hypothetical protein